MKRGFYSVCCAVALALPAGAREGAPHWGDALPHYYEQPDPGLRRARGLLDQGFSDPLVAEKFGAQWNFSLWAANVLAAHPEATEEWCGALKARFKADLFALLFKFAATPGSDKCLKSLTIESAQMRELLAAGVSLEELYAMPVSPATLDARWAGFYATGKAEFVHQVMDYLAENGGVLRESAAAGQEDVPREAVEKLLSAGAARWSLVANMKQYPKVAEIAAAYMATLDADKQQLPREVLQKDG